MSVTDWSEAAQFMDLPPAVEKLILKLRAQNKDMLALIHQVAEHSEIRVLPYPEYPGCWWCSRAIGKKHHGNCPAGLLFKRTEDD